MSETVKPTKKRKLKIVKKVKTKESKESKEDKMAEMKTKYMNQLSDIEREAMEIAKRQLESSFDMEKSINFLKFIE